MHEGVVSAELGFAGYPSVGESVMVERDLALASFEDQPLHLLHLSARESVDALSRAQMAGVRATAEVTPHHLCLTDEAVRSLDANVKMNPPLRADTDRKALVDGLRDGTICAVATDHAPHARHEKDVPFEEAPFGVTGLETAFAALNTYLVGPGLVSLEILLERMSAGAARAYGLEAPRIAVGAPGQLRPARHRVGLARDRGRLPLTLGQLVAPRADAEGSGSAHDRSRPRGPRAMSGALVLEDGEVFAGESVGAEGIAYGEAVFATAMTGYQELVTDPSYACQILSFTAPMIGNYGVAESRSESDRIHVAGVVMREARGPDWTGWLAGNGLPALSSIDTRSLVMHLRDRGSMRAAICSSIADVEETIAGIRAQPSMQGQPLAAGVSTPEPYLFSDSGTARVAVVDYGCKRSILRRLARAGASVAVYPHDVDADELVAYDGVLLSNGPGDPEPLRDEIATLCNVVGRVPVFGICLGHQLLALAAGHETFKLPFGHRGANHPVVERRSGRVLVTSQNHGFAVKPSEAREATHVSLYDGTVEGLDYPELTSTVGPVPPGGRPRATRCVAAARELGRGALCRGVATSTRSC